jgi:diguanylate cyclase (GGDEF)-like protein
MIAKIRHLLQNLPLRRKLLVMSLLLSSFSITCLSITFLVNEFISYRIYISNDIRVQARIVAKNIASPLIFQDHRSARETLEGLESNQRIQAVAVFTADQQLFSMYQKNDSDQSNLLDEFKQLQHKEAHHRALYQSLHKAALYQSLLSAYPVLEEPIVVDHQRVGAVIIQSDLLAMFEHIRFLALLVLIVALLTLGMAIVLGMQFQRLITAPIDALLGAMQQVTLNQDYAHRIPETGNDELGQLMHGFNQMLTEIEIRDQSLFERQQQLDQLAHYDSLTGLANRPMLMDRLHQALHQARRYHQKLAILFIDLDGFKEINDTLGHKAGDELLKQVAARLNSIVRGSDTIARLGGDEFTICLHNVASAESACIVARKVVELYAEPFTLEGASCRITGSVGVSLYPHDAETVEALMKAADTAMYQAKQRGKNNFQLYSTDMQMQLNEKIVLQQHVAKAIERHELFLEYQPIVTTEDKRIVGVEALLRWNHPELGILHPKAFLHATEGADMMHKIGAWVLREACQQGVRWQACGHTTLQVSINLSTAQFKKPDLAADVFSILRETGLPPDKLQLDLSESIIQLTCEAALEQIAYSLIDQQAELPCPFGTGRSCVLHPLYAFKKAGIRLALDNFGTGYSSLGYLHHLPIDTIKISPRFTSCEEGGKSESLLAAIIAMAGSLGLVSIAEGVESEQQFQLLKRMQCQRVQGYLTGRPLSAEGFSRLLDQQVG